MPIFKGAYARENTYLQLDPGVRNRQLCIVRERLRQLGQELFELCCELPKQPDAKGFGEALALVEELRSLRACEERLAQLDKAEHLD